VIVLNWTGREPVFVRSSQNFTGNRMPGTVLWHELCSLISHFTSLLPNLHLATYDVALSKLEEISVRV